MTFCAMIRTNHGIDDNLTAYADYTLDSASTDIRGNGTLTIYLPATPSSNQTITITNIGAGTVTVSSNGKTFGSGVSTVTIPSGAVTIPAADGLPPSATFYYNGYSWGVVWSNCDPIIPNAPHDLGTSQYAGPAETPYGVPQTTTTHTTIGEDPCGNILQKTVTKTYSSRSVANQWIIPAGTAYAGPYVAGYDPLNTDRAHGIGVGATTQAAIDMAASTISTPARFDYIGRPDLWSLLEGGNSNGDSFTTPNVVLYGNYSSGARTNGSHGWSIATLTFGTVYYLDVHEVWTYAAI